jgi:hypothetical protein
VYKEKMFLSDIAHLIASQVVIEIEKLGQPYLGSSSVDNLLTDVVGVREGIERMKVNLKSCSSSVVQ